MTTPVRQPPSTLRNTKEQALLLWFEEFGIGDVSIVGGKNASLGEMIQHLVAKGIRIPNGFATTANAYRRFLEFNGLDAKLRKLFAGLSVEDLKQLRQVGSQARALILEASFPEDLDRAIRDGYARLCEQYGSNTDVAIRSSATAEDLPDASFAGQHETYLNVHGVNAVLEGMQEMLRFDFYGSRLFLSSDPRLRSSQYRPFHRRAENGAVRSLVLRGNVFHRHRDRLHECGAHQCFLWPWRKYRARFGQSR